MLGFHLLDIFFALVAAYLIIRGCMRGFAGEVVTLVGFICSFFFSFKYSAEAGKLIEASTSFNRYFAQLLAIVIIWLAITLLAMLIRMLLKNMLSAMNLGGLNTLLGILSGVFKFVVIVYCFIIVGFLLTPVLNPTWMTESDILRYAGRHWPAVRSFIVDNKLLAHAEQFPGGTLEQALRPYRTGTKVPH